MSQIMKAFTGLFMVLLLMLSATSVLGAFLQVVQAQNYHSAIIDELENSFYALPVLQESFAVAEEMNYELEITLYSDNDTFFYCCSGADLPENTREISMARVKLSYPLELPFFGISLKQELWGYGR